MGEITVVVDHNKIQSDYSVKKTSDLGDLPAKFAAFGWHVERIDGHDTAAIEQTFARLNTITDKPKAVIADTIKGKGVSFMEGTSIDSDVEMFLFHSGAPQAADYTRAAQELLDRINARAGALGGQTVEIETVNRPPAAPPPGKPVGLFPAYTEALLKAAARRPELVALDADLIKDMGLIPFAERYPARFFECGIAEQDMVSMAGGLALHGALPWSTRSRASSPPGRTSKSTTTPPSTPRWSMSAACRACCRQGRAIRTRACARSPRSAACRTW
ncbi:MAG: hypothetical protein WDM92_06100 [Caulobacteraceae bacterium]